MGIDRYTYQSKWAKKSGKFKFVFWLLGILVAFSGWNSLEVVYTLLIMALTLYLVPIRFRTYLNLYIGPVLFLAFSSLALLVSVSQEPALFSWSLPLGDYYLGLLSGQLSYTLTLIIRALTAITVTFFFTLTTPLKQILQLMKQAHIPYVVIELVLLMYRFIFVLLDDVVVVYQAQNLRYGYSHPRVSIHSLALLAKVVLERSLYRFTEMTDTLDLKLYQDEFYLD
ncbi:MULTISPECIES: cobalt ECF transporter T component CbiQ [Aerococcus]|uniref:cobalt ECF transporter T component CbiQ n=1 Tax=Aerococcus TaxID=1375 RepID=UPI000DCAE931|nr:MULTISPECIES: cobalt ECF transporter T component CbiQ [Aerococcus]MDK6688812.1 cobalt ECF transporter T component CbiQ [Aerococcus urinae]MDK8484651.1 cobalt ECF transporter T component CbiQ [Aerococcus urinae]MDL5179498.1 cobalt ECF transporter T component CbiQ [Aerococcus tenax]MDL5208397.1 cobalt ECF transporter T component CbiQ [Aerococcus tenax]RAV92119.1 cobalt ECF transporter T component CbiQ [Aerococcus tenax]